MRRLLLLVLATVLASPAAAAVSLRWAPADQRVNLNANGTLSVMLDEALDLRTIELRVSYAPDLLLSLSGQPGTAFTNAGCTLFPDFDDTSTPGQWYGGVVALGFDCWVTGPGELYRWNFRGLANGVSPIETLMVKLYDPMANLIAEVNLSGTTVIVGAGTASPPPPAPGLELGIAPNPFNPSCRITLAGSAPGPARLEVFDLGGRRVASPWQGELGADARSFDWRAVDAAGCPLPSGVYLFRLSAAADQSLTRRGVLLK